MWKMLLKSSFLGIDFRPDFIKVAYLQKKRNKSIIKRLYQIKNPIGKVVFENQQEQDTIQQLFSTIKQKFPSRGVIMGIPSNHAVFRYVNFPILSGKELKEAIFWEMQEFNTIIRDEYVSDYEILDEKNNICRVLLVAVPKYLAMTYANILLGAGFYIKALDLYPLAHARVLKTKNKSGVSAIIDFNYIHNEITIVENGSLILNRNLDFHHDSTIEQKVIEISKIFNFYSLQSKSKQIEEIILLGKAREQREIFKSSFNINVYTDNEIELDFIIDNLQVMDKPIGFFSAIGFALRG
jgi:type IV pilus assembly protein PilM